MDGCYDWATNCGEDIKNVERGAEGGEEGEPELQVLGGRRREGVVACEQGWL